jgi:hypothetical protein
VDEAVKACLLSTHLDLRGISAFGCALTSCAEVNANRQAADSRHECLLHNPVFKLERWLLTRVLSLPSTDCDAQALAEGQVSNFAAWRVESREADQTILAAWSTRSWLMVASQSSGGGIATTLFFGSVVVPRTGGGLGWQFTTLRGFHKLCSRILLGSAASRLARGMSWSWQCVGHQLTQI